MTSEGNAFDSDARFVHSFELGALGRPSVAVGVIDMVSSMHEWIHRRVEKLEILSEKTALRRVSLDLTIPKPALSTCQWANGRNYVLLPIDLLAKEPLRRFSISDATGLPVPTLTRRQNGHLSWRGLVGLAADSLTPTDIGVPVWMEELLRVIAQDDVVSANSELGVLMSLASRPPERSELLSAARSVADEGFLTLATSLANNFVLIAVVEADPGERLILKYEFEESLVDPRSDERTTGQRLLEQLSWHPTTQRFPALSFTECESYHFEAAAPSGIQMLDVVLVDEAPDLAAIPGDSARPSLDYRWLGDSSPHLAYLSTSRTSDPGRSGTDYVLPRVRVGLRVDRSGWLRNVAASSTMVATIFWLSLVVIRLPDFGGSSGSSDPAAVTAALLGIISVGVVRSGEHAFTSRLVRPLRALALASASIPFLGAWLLAFMDPGGVRTILWALLAVLATLCAVGLVLVTLRRAPSPAHPDDDTVSQSDGSIMDEKEEPNG